MRVKSRKPPAENFMTSDDVTSPSAYPSATIVTLGMPMLERGGLGDRLKTVARRREELRARHHAALNAKRGSLRVEPTTYMKATLDKFKLSKVLEGEDSREKLAAAGYRGQAPLITFMFFRFVMPFIVFAGTAFYLFLIARPEWSTLTRWLAAFAGGAKRKRAVSNT